jgi:hypothetical protein
MTSIRGYMCGLVVASLAAGLTLVACGGDDDDDNGGTGGAGFGSGGASASGGGTSASGGAAGGGMATGGNTAAGGATTAGGRTGFGGRSGRGGDAGGTGTPGCVRGVQTGSVCDMTVDNVPCVRSDRTCTCQAGNTWQCTSTGDPAAGGGFGG